MLEFRELEVFVAVADSLHFRAAAERLRTSQPVLSRTIARLERRLGVRLFDRSTRRVTLTAAGDALLTDARKLLDGLGEAVVRVREAAEPRQLTLAMRPGTGQGRMARVLAAYQERAAGVPVRLHFTHAQEEALRDGTAQVALTCQTGELPADLSSIHVEDESPVALLPSDHALAGRPEVTAAELAELPQFSEVAPPAGMERLLDEVAMGRQVFVAGGSVASRLRSSVTAVPVLGWPSATLRLAWLPTTPDTARDQFLAVARGVLAD